MQLGCYNLSATWMQLRESMSKLLNLHIYLVVLFFAAGVNAQVRDGVGDDEETISIVTDKILVDPYQTNSATSRRAKFLESFANKSSGNSQLSSVVSTTPGVIVNSTNQFHARGEHAGSFIYLDGFQLGGVAQGRLGPLIDTNAFESVDVTTGGFSPEFVGGAGIIDAELKSGRSGDKGTIEVGGGSYGASMSKFSLAGSSKAGSGDADIYYYLGGMTSASGNASEAPQPRNQDAHNFGLSQSYLAHIEYETHQKDSVRLILSSSPARTQIANRVGLPEEYAPYGQGFGFGGLLSRSQAESLGIESQEALNQNIYQDDLNSIGMLQWQHAFTPKTKVTWSVGGVNSVLNTLNKNPGNVIDVLPFDSSIEFNPTVKRESTQGQISGKISTQAGAHEITAGGIYNDESSKESYHLVPQSQLALNALYAADPRLAPHSELVLNADGSPQLDANGNSVVRIVKGSKVPTLKVKADGFFSGVYIQDHWKMSEALQSTFGVRFDAYEQQSDLDFPKTKASQFSPRVAFAYEVFPTWIVRTSYDRLFIEPPVAQGAVIGEGIKPERVHQGEISLEKEIARNQKAKVAVYKKRIQNQIDTSLLIPSTQMGLFNSVNLDRAEVTGLEVSYDLLPSGSHGWGSYVVYTRSVAQPKGFDSTGSPVEDYNDHDQRYTAQAGAAYTFASKESISIEALYGSGLASSVLSEGGNRKSNTRVDLSATTNEKFLFGVAGLKCSVTNIFDERNRINFNSGFSGTRFQQGRAIVLSTFFNF
jgi:outer membrane receptor protein involved in Fe transport